MANQYRGFNGKTYKTSRLEIFMHPTLNGQEEWHVSGVESDSYCICHGTPRTDEALIKSADRMIRHKYDFIGEILFSIRRANGDIQNA